MTLPDLLRTLNAKGRHPKWRAKCPIHQAGAKRGDKRTLAIFADEGDEIGLYCFSGCEKDDILSAMGLTWKDLKPQRDWLPTEAFKAMKDKEREAQNAAIKKDIELRYWIAEVNRWERIAAMLFTHMLTLGRTPQALHAADIWHKALYVARMRRERLWALQREPGVYRNKLGEVDCYVVKEPA